MECSKIIIRNAFFLVLLQAAFASMLLAEDSSESIRVKFTSISWDKPIQEELFVLSGGEMMPLQIHTMQRSKLVDYRGNNPIIFYRKSSNPSADIQFVPVAQVRVNSSLVEPLFIFFKQADDYRIFVVEDSFEAFPVGSYRFLNLTDKDMIAQLGSNKIALNPRTLDALKGPFERTLEYQVAFVVREEDGLAPIYYNRWMHVENYRYLILISESKSRDTGPINFRILSDINLAQ
ncbi:hypothetical protein [Cerasicoccus frondis]|uniref:hypothetical protein n=1 Tax=Cerasicoccus frondis TaxID=490090 RepID=UPI00285254A4|nr:hypothetical protein [Cerasicoccus frondis]